MKIKKPEKRQAGSLSRQVMIMTGRRGRRPINRALFMLHRERILTAWSRINLEGRSATWSPRNVLPSIFVNGEKARDLELRFTETDDALWRSILWQR